MTQRNELLENYVAIEFLVHADSVSSITWEDAKIAKNSLNWSEMLVACFLLLGNAHHFMIPSGRFPKSAHVIAPDTCCLQAL